MSLIPQNLLFPALRMVGLGSAFLALIFFLNNFLIFGIDAPGVVNTLGLDDMFGTSKPNQGYNLSQTIIGITQTGVVFGSIVFAIWRCMTSSNIRDDARWMDDISAYIVRMSFWGVLLVGIADAVLSFLRVEGFHTVLFGEAGGASIALPSERGLFIHVPLIIMAGIIAFREKSVSLVWLTLLVVIAEFLIVVARFIYGYEQTFMGDLVRFWYAALFLFASAYTLKEDAHVRVDVFYASFRRRTRSILNVIGTVFFGIPLCWLILLRGLWGKSSLINSPMFNFETSMSGFGMYVKYLMAAFLVVFALSMLFQFTAYLFNSLADIEENVVDEDAAEEVVA